MIISFKFERDFSCTFGDIRFAWLNRTIIIWVISRFEGYNNNRSQIWCFSWDCECLFVSNKLACFVTTKTLLVYYKMCQVFVLQKKSELSYWKNRFGLSILDNDFSSWIKFSYLVWFQEIIKWIYLFKTFLTSITERKFWFSNFYSFIT